MALAHPRLTELTEETRGSSPPPSVESASAGPLFDLARRYLESWGLSKPWSEQAAAELVRAVVGRHGSEPSDELRRTVIGLGRRWIEHFARGALGFRRDWFWRAQSLLRRFPRAFLETPLPRSAGDVVAVEVLPAEAPETMIQQALEDPFERLSGRLRDTVDRMRDGRMSSTLARETP